MKKTLFAASALLFAYASSFAITGKEVVQKYFDTNPAPDFSKTEFKVESFKSGRPDDALTLIQFGRNKSELTETVFEVTKNPNSKGTRFLQSQKPGEDARFIYMPSLRTTRRIAAQDGSKAFVGTEFTYNDTALRELNDDTHELLSEETVSIKGKSYKCWAVKSVPVSKKNLEFDYRIQYFDQQSVMPVKIDYFDKAGALTKTMEITKLTVMTGATGKKHYIRQVTEMTNKKTGRSSVLTILSMELDKELKAGYFSQNWLSTGKL